MLTSLEKNEKDSFKKHMKRLNLTLLPGKDKTIQTDKSKLLNNSFTQNSILTTRSAKLRKDFLKLKKVFIKLGTPRGAINFEVLGSGKSGGFTSLGSATIASLYSMTGMGFDGMGSVLMGSSEGTPSVYSDSADPRYIKINKKLKDIQLRITTNSLDADYTLQSFIFSGNQLRVNPPSSWKVN